MPPGGVSHTLLVLRRSTAFQQLSAPDRRFLVRHCKERTLQRGEAVVSAGGPANAVIIVVQGKLLVRGGAAERAMSPRRTAQPAKPWAQPPVASPRHGAPNKSSSRSSGSESRRISSMMWFFWS